MILRKLIVRVGVRRFFRQARANALPGVTLSAENLEAIDQCEREFFGDVLDEARGAIEADPVGSVKLATAAGEGERPFLDWLFKEGGWRVIYGIVQMILMAFGIILPPIPPTP